MSMMELDTHPVWETIQGYGSSNTSQSWLTFMVYMDITEAKGWWNVKTHVCGDLDLVFLSGHASRSKPREIILPVTADYKLSPAELHNLLQKLKIPGCNTEGLVLGICGGCANTVYYRVIDGLVLPESPDVTEWKKYRREETPSLQRHHVMEQKSVYMARTRDGNTSSEAINSDNSEAKNTDNSEAKNSDNSKAKNSDNSEAKNSDNSEDKNSDNFDAVIREAKSVT